MITSRTTANRVVVALDASLRNLSTLPAAASLADRHRAALVVLFVEDVDLLQLAEHPMATEVRHFGAPRRLELASLSRALKGSVARARLALDEATRSISVKGSLQVIRGRYISTSMAATGDRDVLFLSRATGVDQRTHLYGANRASSAWVLYEAGDAGDRALRLACDLNGPGGSISVLIQDGPMRERAAARVRAEKTIGPELTAHYRRVTNLSCAGLRAAISTPRDVTLVLSKSAPVIADPQLYGLLETVRGIAVVT